MRDAFTVNGHTRNRLRPLAAGDTRPFKDQIAERLREAITDGSYQQGERLPGINALARYYKVGAHISYEALLLLQHEGLARVVRRHGTFVRGGGGEARHG